MIDWALNTRLEYRKLLYTNVQGTVNTYAEIQNMQKLFCSNSLNSYSEMFQKKLFVDCKGDMRGVDHSYPGVQLAAWNVTMEDIFIKCIFLRPI